MQSPIFAQFLKGRQPDASRARGEGDPCQRRPNVFSKSSRNRFLPIEGELTKRSIVLVAFELNLTDGDSIDGDASTCKLLVKEYTT
jgi:hypothetical protein